MRHGYAADRGDGLSSVPETEDESKMLCLVFRWPPSIFNKGLSCQSLIIGKFELVEVGLRREGMMYEIKDLTRMLVGGPGSRNLRTQHFEV